MSVVLYTHTHGLSAWHDPLQIINAGISLSCVTERGGGETGGKENWLFFRKKKIENLLKRYYNLTVVSSCVHYTSLSPTLYQKQYVTPPLLPPSEAIPDQSSRLVV